MIILKNGSIFDSTADCLVNPVNCVGVMGKGLALEFKHRFPPMFQLYKNVCTEGKLTPGKVAFWRSSVDASLPMICLFPTKNHWRDKSTLSLIETGLHAFVKYSPKLDIKSVAFPKIGCGLGGLDFQLQVYPLMVQYLSDLPMTVEIYID